MPLLGIGESLLDDEKDMLALHAEKEPDRLSAFVKDHLGYHLSVGVQFPIRNTFNQH